MSTRVNNPVGPSSSTLTMAVHPAGSGTEVPGPVPENPVPTAGPQEPAVPLMGTAGVFQTFLTAFQPMVNGLDPHLRQPAAGVVILTARASHVAAAPLVVNLLLAHPDLAPRVDPTVLRAGLDTLSASRQLSDLLVQVAALVSDTGRMDFDDSWQQCRAVIAAAEVVAKRDKSMTQALAPVRSALGRGPRTAASGNATEAARQRVTKAQARVDKAQQHAATVHGAAVRTQAAHAARHPATATSPVPLANPQGPAASADVAPQGPAPVPAPGR